MTTHNDREIRFRAWDSKANQMYDYEYIETYTIAALRDERYHLMQYTGLKDKNGVEIYEGDVVRYETIKGQFGLHQIIYLPDAAAFLLQAITKASINPIGMKYLGDIARSNKQYDTRTYELCEVIGNIYENPELLTAKPSLDVEGKV